jgi:diaminopimelate decarboxylase
VTLAELLPSVGACGEPDLEDGLWPAGTQLASEGDLLFGGLPTTHLAARFGTPCQLLDEAEVRRRARMFRRLLPDAEIAFAGKSLPCRSVYRWMAEEGLSLDVCSAGEIAVAQAAGFPAERMLLHGNVKTAEDVKAALGAGIGRVVLDSFDEIGQLATLVRQRQDVLIRVTPDVDPGTHHPAVTTGVADQKFGLGLADGAAAGAVREVLERPELRLVGLHCHLGSQIRSVYGYERAVNRMVGLLARLTREHGVTFEQLNIGGGHGIRYTESDRELRLAGFADRVPSAVRAACERHGVAEPRLTIEPGRALVGPAGIALYQVAAVKRRPGGRTFVAVDGGMSDNPRPALYGAQYAVRLLGRPLSAPERPVTVVGRHCEAGDVLAADVELPEDVHAGDLLAVPVAGAYQLSMASNYNLVGRPPVVAVAGGSSRLLVRRESEADLLRREVGLG